MNSRRHGFAATVAALFPEIGIGVMLFDAARQRVRVVRATEQDRGDAVQWVILVAVGAAIAITVGTIIYNKLKTKANNITTDTPAAGQ
jgi:hypothetical protein